MPDQEKGRPANAVVSGGRGERSSLMMDDTTLHTGHDEATRGNENDRIEASLSPDMQQFIGRQLRAVYDDVAKQPVPDRFLELMKQLDSKTGVR